jgi:hypothetical protein
MPPDGRQARSGVISIARNIGRAVQANSIALSQWDEWYRDQKPDAISASRREEEWNHKEHE